jgi:phospholipid/cholesterol/gamma-HCH transport system substrate-binding protein
MGLQEGGSVRFVGITIGSVHQINIVNDTLVNVAMKIGKEHSRFIQQDATAVINSDGLMGNKLISILPGQEVSRHVSDGDTIQSKKPIGMENVMNSVLENSRNLETLTKNLINITEKISDGKGMVGKLLFDTATSRDFEQIIAKTNRMSDNLEDATANIHEISEKITKGEGTLGKLVYNDSLANSVNGIMDSLTTASGNINAASRDINTFTEKLNSGKGPISRLVYDTAMAENLDETIINARERSAELEETIEIVNESWILNLFSKRKKKDESADDY